ncbi:MAG: DUF4114 domain-containing protein [Deltaproteobacteria bacterium]|nr:DUF4114 domain-containing protein [Deltaproteobacteria bacterium]
MRRTAVFLLATLAAIVATPSASHAYINQADGTVVPVTTRLQQCLDLSEGTPMAVDAIADAAILPEAYRPVFDAVSGHYRVSFTDIGEGAGYRNTFGWFWVGEDVTNPANLRTIFGCRTYPTCNCPCTTTRTVSVDFDLQSGFSVGRQIGFWLRSPERLTGGTSEDGTFPSGCPMDVGCDPAGANVNDSCGGRLDTNNRIYFTSAALNDDGDFVHFLVHRSATRVNTFYFGFEDLYRGGDNDYEDMLVRGSGLVPECDPRPEACDNDDDDCDGMIDEGLTMACSTACGAGTRRCMAGSFGACSARVPSSETCNTVDDDCDASTDEGLSRACSNACGTGTEICLSGTFGGCTARTPTLETCNNTDDDCDGRVDEGISRACASDCGSGTETCVAGVFGACSAPPPDVEVCNADDDDCDGRVDEGLVRDCSNSCGTGTEVCRGGVFSGCTAPAAGVEACNNLDDDCDGMIDEGITRACSTACGVGSERCVAGMFVDCDAPLPADEICNNVDDDCDGVIDDGNPGGGDSCVPLPGGGFEPPPDAGPDVDGGVICRAGTTRCLMGELACQGAASGGSELCNCLDDDCDGNVDEETSADPLCPGGACVATECTCASPCDPGEFPCPPGRVCDESIGDPGMGIRGYCVAGRCSGVACDMESVCNPETGECENLCDDVMCPSGYGCVRGTCVEDNCYGRGCPAGQICRTEAGGTPACVEDACMTTSCATGEFCRDGACVATCDVVCDIGTLCEDGVCVDDACDGECGANRTCVEGRCVADTCTPGCGRGRVCRAGSCVDDPCRAISCPGALVCDEGECIDPAILPRPDAMRGLAAGGGGCLCSVVGAPSAPSTSSRALWVIAGLLLLGLSRRRVSLRRASIGRTRVKQLSGIAITTVLAIGAEGCAVDPFCFSGCDEERLDAAVFTDAGRPDTGGGGSVDGCTISGDEICDAIDNDCDGLTDEEFDLEGDPRNCGRCGQVCTLDHAFPGCTMGECAVERCEIGWVDLDGVPANGCEYGCPPDGDELCDERDNDCDGRTDEGFDLTSEIAHCGTCATQCQFPNGTPDCVDSVCVLTACNSGYVDSDGDPSNGCEYACTPGAGGVEVCNGVDDDCDRMIDDGFDTATDAMNCGACGRTCVFPNASGRCVASACTFGPADCDPGWFDVDGDPRTGCEYMCTPSGAADTCNRVDDDCDGAIDEADPMVGSTCGVATGACDSGTTACVRGALTCVGGIGAIDELCNAVDDDCDGRTDESVAPTPIRGVGDRCGATDVGICSYGAVACGAGGAFVCSGEVRAGTESCNGLDDDCDGAADDSLTTPSAASVPSCAETRGVCAGRTPTCRGAVGWACDLPALYQMVETRCDTLDNDCDGTADEGCLRPTGTDRRLDTQSTQSQTNSLRPVIASSGANVQVIWTETIFRDPDLDARVYYARSIDNGGSFNAATRLNTTNGDTFGPQVMFSASNVLWAWADFRGGTNYREIWTRRSTDAAGSTPAATEIRANASGTTATTDSYNVRIALAGTTMFAAYEAFTTARSRHIFLSHSTDSGATWSAPSQVSTSALPDFIAAQPRIAATADRVYVVWRDNRSGSLDVFLRAWNVTTAAFVATEQRMDTGTTAGSSSSFSADVAAEGTNAYVVWVDDRDRGSFDIWLNRSTNSGSTWLSNAVKLDGDTLDHDSIEPHAIAPDTGDVLVSWIDYRSGFPDPYVVRSTTAGATFGTVERVDTGTAPGASGSYDLAIAGVGNVIGIAWSDDRSGLLDVYTNFSLDQGATWQPQDYRLDSSTVGTSDSQEPTIAVSGSRIHVAWTDHRRGTDCPTGTAGDTSCSNGDIYYRRLE